MRDHKLKRGFGAEQHPIPWSKPRCLQPTSCSPRGILELTGGDPTTPLVEQNRSGQAARPDARPRSRQTTLGGEVEIVGAQPRR
jgi:hypothetical protein